MEAACTAIGIAASLSAAYLSNVGKDANTPSLFSQCIAGGAANAYTSALLNPLDVCKTKMQVEIMKGDERSRSAHGSMLRSMRTLYQESGFLSLWTPGLTATMVREMVNCSARTGLYVPVRNAISSLSRKKDEDPDVQAESSKDANMATRMLAAIVTGTLGSVISNPVDVVKVRLLAASDTYPSTFAAYPELFRSEGLGGIFRGVVPSTMRGASIACGELAAYDQSKVELKARLGLTEGAALHIGSSLISGVVATTFAAPFDLLKTRAMNAQSSASAIGVLLEVVREESPRALLRGWVPAYMRLGPHALLCLPLFEQLRALVGAGYI